MTKRAKNPKRAKEKLRRIAVASPNRGKTTAEDRFFMDPETDAGKAEVRRDLTTVSKAVVERWPTQPELRLLLRQKLQRIAATTDDPRLFNRLMQTDLQMEGQNQRDQVTTKILQARHDLVGPLDGASIEQAQIIIMVPDNGRGGRPIDGEPLEDSETDDLISG